MPETPPSKEEMIKCLERSGYCMEGRIVKTLDALGYFVEPSQAHYDEQTGKSREIDLVAESYRHVENNQNVCVKTNLVIEAINNLYPVVLLTPKLWTPNTVYEDFLPFCSMPPVTSKLHPFFIDHDHAEIFGIMNWNLFAQYCAFTRKKQGGELMASHSEDLHAAIQKAVDYAFYLRDLSSEWMNRSTDHYWRIFNWQPVIVVQNDLHALNETQEGGYDLANVPVARLQLNFHHKGEPKTVVVTFVTEAALPDFGAQVLARDATVEDQMIKTRLSGS